MKLRALPLLCSLAVASVCTTAHATLIGDTITMQHFFPTYGTPLGSILMTVVSAGTGDVFTQGSNYTANPEATGIQVRFLRIAAFTSTPFNGLVVTEIDDTIFGVTVSTNLVGWDNSRISFDAHSVSANFQQLGFTADSFFDVFFQITPGTNPTPDTGTTAALLGVSLLGLFALRRKLGAAQT